MKRKVLLFLFMIMISIFGITNIYALDTYDGDYSLEYLIRNYNIVTFGTKDIYDYRYYNDYIPAKGSIKNVFEIGGPVLVRGDYLGNPNFENQFAQKTNCVPSYVKGRFDYNIKAGSIEGSDLSSIYVGSINALHEQDGYYIVNGNQYKYKYPVKTSDDYLDFDKLYAAVVNDQKKLMGGQKIQISEKDSISNPDVIISISSPGVYTLESTRGIHYLNFENFDENSLYVINILDSNVEKMVGVVFDFRTPDSFSVYNGRLTRSVKYAGNIIWNFPNARHIITNCDFYGHIVAPKADVDLMASNSSGAILANSVTGKFNHKTAVQFFPYELSQKLDSSNNTVVTEEKDIDEDLYQGNYSLDELLKNYSVVALGQKEYGSNTKLSTLTDAKGTVNIFHIVGQFLINGNLATESSNFKGYLNPTGMMRLDLFPKNTNSYSFLKGKLMKDAYQDEVYFSHSPSSHTYFSTNYNGNPKFATYNVIIKKDNFINFKTLYDAIVEQQEKISAGTVVRPDSNNEVHIPIGGNYTIENISDASKIVFDNYMDNKNKLTIVTINDSGSINMPFESSDSWSNYSTNDYNGGFTYYTNGSTLTYEELYYGNIVFNIPNATYIKLADENAFKGHIIAPNADLEMPEMNFAGAMIVNSLYSEGRSEAHFYPLKVGSVGTGIKKELVTIGSNEEEKTSLKVEKKWEDNDNQDGKRPEKVTINLLANGEKIDSVELSEENNWQYEFKDLVKRKNGVIQMYTIIEVSTENYSVEMETDGVMCPEGCTGRINNYTITNKYTPEKTSLTVNKVWVDENDFDKIRPESVEVELYANGEKIDSHELTSKDNWTYIFNELDMYSNGEKIEYTIKEKETEGYTSEISGNQEEGYTITNTHEVEHKKEVKAAEETKEDNPITLDSIIKYISIFGVSIILLVLGITIYIKKRKEV